MVAQSSEELPHPTPVTPQPPRAQGAIIHLVVDRKLIISAYTSRGKANTRFGCEKSCRIQFGRNCILPSARKTFVGQGGAGLLHEEKQSRTKDSPTVAEQVPGSDSNRPRKSRMANQAPQPTLRSVKARTKDEAGYSSYPQSTTYSKPAQEKTPSTPHALLRPGVKALA
ncbi:hypothetical protein Anapl_05101 [Anas platyrhynchos]|uniref:Uncharacterized protein n=1 Tax=Anas platyrhynchos TaxID=8839 RepID=R0LBR2_ANAPL|nr:hypothetical protein Anapl_05101 [Anas platyrhynchos]